jgi:hypothetical protein
MVIIQNLDLQKHIDMTRSTTKNEWLTIPILPCTSIEETLSFWQSLGYNITYKQTRPYQYGVVESNGSALHFVRVKGMDATNNFYTGCLVIVADAGEICQRLSADLKKLYGKVPHTGIPRMSRMKPGATRFTLTDVSGNSVIFVSRGNNDQENWEQADIKTGSKLQKAIAMAKRFRDYKNDDEAVAKVLDTVLKMATDEDPNLAEALVMRIEIALHRGEQSREQECRQKLATLELDHHTLSLLEERHKTS